MSLPMTSHELKTGWGGPSKEMLQIQRVDGEMKSLQELVLNMQKQMESLKQSIDTEMQAFKKLWTTHEERCAIMLNTKNKQLQAETYAQEQQSMRHAVDHVPVAVPAYSHPAYQEEIYPETHQQNHQETHQEKPGIPGAVNSKFSSVYHVDLARGVNGLRVRRKLDYLP